MQIIPAVDEVGNPIPDEFIVLDENGDKVFGPASEEACRDYVRKRREQPEPPKPF